jgi:hypothetical protein
MPLVPTPARLKLFHACDQWHSSRMFTFTPLTGSHCKLRPNTEGRLQSSRLQKTQAHSLQQSRLMRARNEVGWGDTIRRVWPTCCGRTAPLHTTARPLWQPSAPQHARNCPNLRPLQLPRWHGHWSVNPTLRMLAVSRLCLCFYFERVERVM